MFRGFIFSCMDSFEGLYSIGAVVGAVSDSCVGNVSVSINQSINLLYGRWSKEEKDRRKKKKTT